MWMRETSDVAVCGEEVSGEKRERGVGWLIVENSGWASRVLSINNWN